MTDTDMQRLDPKRNPLDDFSTEVRLAAEDLRLMRRRFLSVALVKASENKLHGLALRAAKREARA